MRLLCRQSLEKDDFVSMYILSSHVVERNSEPDERGGVSFRISSGAPRKEELR